MKQLVASFFLVITATTIMTVAGYLLAERRLNRVYDLNLKPIVTSEKKPDIKMGRDLFVSVALCAGCHGKDLGG